MVKKDAAKGAGGDSKPTYVPPPPPDGPKIPAPLGLAPPKVYPVSGGPQPACMSIPNVATEEKADGAGEPQEAAGENAADADDGFSPEERRKNELSEDPNFKKFLSMYRMKIPVHNIRAKIRDEGTYKKEDLDLFWTEEEKKDADFMLI